MKRFAELRPGTNIVHYIHETEEKPEFHPSFVLIDVTEVEGIQEGYLYDEASGLFYKGEAQVPDSEPPADPYQEMQLQTLLNTEMLLIYKEFEM